MDAHEPGLFDLPDRESPAPPQRLQHGRNREAWSRTATAEVTIIDAEALHEAAARVGENAVTIGIRAALDVKGTDLDVKGTELDGPVEPVNDAFDAVGWLVWPTEGMERAMEGDAFRILSVNSEVVAESVDRGSVTWTVTVKLTDVDELRRLAAQVHPEATGSIEASLAVAWQCAADPFAPLRSIPGTAWTPGQVVVEHMRAKAAGKH